MNSVTSLGGADLKSLQSLHSFEQFGNEVSLEEAIMSLAPLRDHQRINKWQTKVQSILNTRRRNGQIDIHSVDDWTNPDDLSLNRVVVAYHPAKQHVRISVFQNVAVSGGAIDLQNPVDMDDDDDVEPERIVRNERSFDKSLPHDLIYRRKIPRAQAIDIFKRFDWSMDKLIDHMYIATEGTGRGAAKIKLADPVQVKRILVRHQMKNSIAGAQQANLSFQPNESGQ